MEIDARALTVVGIVFTIVLVTIVVVFFTLRRLGYEQEASQKEHSTVRRPAPVNLSRIEATMGGPTRDSQAPSIERRVQTEINQLRVAGYQPRLFRLERESICMTVAGPLPNRDRSATIYLRCTRDFPSAPPEVYVELLGGPDLDDFGATPSQEVRLDHLEVLETWSAEEADLLKVVREAFARLDESYRRATELSGFLDRYGDWIHPPETNRDQTS